MLIMTIKMHTILITNSRNNFGKELIMRLKGRHNLIVSGNTKSNTYSIVTENVDHINSNLLQDSFSTSNNLIQDVIFEANTIVDHGNKKYKGINICVDCSNNKLNTFSLSGLILHQIVANNCFSATDQSCKLLYNNNTMLTDYFNNQVPKKSKAYNCNGSVDEAVAIIDSTFKFSTGMDVPYFEFDQNLITSRL